NIHGDPLTDLPTLSLNPPPFVPTGCYTAEHCDIIDDTADKLMSSPFLTCAVTVTVVLIVVRTVILITVIYAKLSDTQTDATVTSDGPIRPGS
ncbi:hypothetical protein B0H10DRAFT_1855314, partial [Mycena sp. CBHHK59/15]